MGTSAACMFATIYYSMHEIESFLKQFMNQPPTSRQTLQTMQQTLQPTNNPIMLYGRFIDDAIQIWDAAKLPNNITTHNLTETISDKMQYGLLKWDVEPPSKQANFLDLTITLEDNGSFTTRTYIKPNNLHLYIPPHSAHSQGVLKSLIFGNIQRYWHQNTHHSTFTQVTKDFYKHLTNRGYKPEVLQPLFMEVAKLIDERTQRLSVQPTPTTSNRPQQASTQLFLHWEFHPTDIARKQIQRVYQETAGPVFKRNLDVDKLTVAYSNPKSLRRCLTKTQLEEPAGEQASLQVEQLKQI